MEGNKNCHLVVGFVVNVYCEILRVDKFLLVVLKIDPIQMAVNLFDQKGTQCT